MFDDETTSIDVSCFEKLYVRLVLLSEEQDIGEPLKRIDPLEDKLHSTMAYYEFLHPEELQKLKDSGLCNPPNLPVRGAIDFVRRRYKRYPTDAIRW